MGFFEEHDRKMKRFMRLFWVFFAAVAVLIVAGWITVGCVATKMAKTIDKDGLQSVVERVWKGDRHEPVQGNR